MRLTLLLQPDAASSSSFHQQAVVVFDVLRATTTMTAALAAGVGEIRVFGDIDSARQAACAVVGAKPLLCGESQCLAPPGFDLGNSPGALTRAAHGGRTLFMSTTNGTRAIIAARSARLLLAGAIVNASAVARVLARAGMDVTLLCAGTNGEAAIEDVIGAGAVADALLRLGRMEAPSDLARMAVRLFNGAKGDLRGALSEGAGGRNVIAAGLGADIEFAARLDVMETVGRVEDGPLRVIRYSG